MKLGGSDYHGRGGHGESDLGSVSLPVVIVNDFLKLARPIWCKSIKDLLESYADQPSDPNLKQIMKFKGIFKTYKTDSPKDLIDACLSLWLSKEERQNAEFEAVRLKLSHISVN